jgi:CRISPR-associated protein Cas1
MEEFRPLVADSVVILVVNNGVMSPDDFLQSGPSFALSPAGRKKFIQAYESRLSSEITHPIFGYRISYRRVLEVQLRLLGRWLTNEIAEYPVFTTR